MTWNRYGTSRLYSMLALATIVGLTYFGSFSGAFISDDQPMIGDNLKLESTTFIAEAFRKSVWENSAVVAENKSLYRPLYLAWYFSIHALAGKNPYWFHVANTLLHLINTLLVSVLIRRLFPSSSVYQQTAGAALFAVHPANTEAVAWISGGTDLLMVLLLLIALHSLARYRESAGGLFLVVSILSFSLALLTKETAIVFPLLAFAYDRTIEAPTGHRTSRVYYLWLIAASILYLSVRFSVLHEPDKSSPFVFDAGSVLRWWEYICLAARYLVLPWPQPFYFLYPPQGIANLWDFMIGGSVLAGGIYLYARWKMLRFALLWTGIMVLPPTMLAFHEFGTFALRFLYPSTVMIGVLFAVALMFLTGRGFKVTVITGVAAVSVCSLLTALTTRDFSGEKSFYTKVLEYDPTHAGSYASLGKYYLAVGDTGSALKTYTEGVANAADQEYRQSLLEDLALLYAAIGKYRKSIESYQSLADSPDARVVGLVGIANNYWMLKDYRQALSHYRQALSLDDSNFDALYNYALLNEQAGDNQEAHNSYRKLLKLVPAAGREQQVLHARTRIEKLVSGSASQ